MASAFSFRGTVGRGEYAMTGITLFAVKCTLDRYLLAAQFRRVWVPWSYLYPPEWVAADLRSGIFEPLLTLIVVALPFVWFGLALTAQRLRTLGYPPALLLLFFVPYVNLLFFALLSLLPDPDHREWVKEWTGGGRFAQLVPYSKWGSAAFGILFTGILGLLLAALSVSVFINYGWGVFVGIPFLMGLLSAYFYGYHERRTALESIGVGALSISLLGILLLLFAFEGVVCIVMAAPIGFALACLGGYLSYVFQGERRAKDDMIYAVSAPLLLALLIGGEALIPKEPALFTAVTSIEIAAPPETVWENVVTFSEIPPPEHWLFKTGVAYPIRARIEGTGPGAVRHCEFSTGAFVEPIEVWDSPRLLRFGVTHNPPPLAEWSPLRDIHPPHLDNFFQSERGQFLLTPLPGGGTRLEGTTWYRHYIWPAVYWKAYSGFIVHRIHERVLEHIKGLSERQVTLR